MIGLPVFLGAGWLDGYGLALDRGWKVPLALL